MPVLAPVTRAVFPCWSGTSATVHRLLVASRLFMATSLSTLRTVRSRSISIRPIIGTSVPVQPDYTGRPSRLSIEPWSVDQTDEGPIRHRRIVRRLRWSRWAAVARRRAAQQEARSGGGRRRVHEGGTRGVGARDRPSGGGGHWYCQPPLPYQRCAVPGDRAGPHRAVRDDGPHAGRDPGTWRGVFR